MGNKKIDTNSNIYIMVYAAVMVIVVAFLLAFVYAALKPKSDANVEIDNKSQILASLNIHDLDDEAVVAKYGEVVVADEIVNAQGAVVNEGLQKDSAGFRVSRKNIASDNLPVFVCDVNGQRKYVLPLSGKGLWGPIWGYIALNDDKETIFGAYFNHESETAGLGALIVEEKFQSKFAGKKLRAGENILSVVKFGKVQNPEYECDGISGATKTCDGVSEMIADGVSLYDGFLNQK